VVNLENTGSVLITGGAGFIGSHLVEYLAGWAKVRVLDNFRTGAKANLQGLAVEVCDGSILDPDALKPAMKGIRTVVHLAAMASVPESLDQPQLCLELNDTGTLRVLTAAAEAGVKRFIFASSSAVYGSSSGVPQVECMTPNPETPYAVSKYLGEQHVERFLKADGMSTVSLRLFNVFGPRQPHSEPYAAVVAGFLEKARRGAPIILHGSGEQTRDFVFVKDVVLAMAHFMERPALTGAYNIGYGAPVSVRELAEKILQLTGAASSILHSSPRAGDISHSLASIGKLKGAGFTPRHGFEEGLRKTLEEIMRLGPALERLV
jgi:UDP-glucose 4-epimerase